MKNSIQIRLLALLWVSIFYFNINAQTDSYVDTIFYFEKNGLLSFEENNYKHKLYYNSDSSKILIDIHNNQSLFLKTNPYLSLDLFEINGFDSYELIADSIVTSEIADVRYLGRNNDEYMMFELFQFDREGYSNIIILVDNSVYFYKKVITRYNRQGELRKQIQFYYIAKDGDVPD